MPKTDRAGDTRIQPSDTDQVGERRMRSPSPLRERALASTEVGRSAEVPLALKRQAQEIEHQIGAEEFHDEFVTFDTANQQVDVRHGLRGIPSGFKRLRGTICNVYDEPGVPWTDDIAFVRTDAATVPVYANLRFYRNRQDERETTR